MCIRDSYSFESFIIPPAIYRYDIATGKTETFAKPTVPFASDRYEVKQVFYKSKDGTSIPMFISSKKGVKRDGNTPTLMSAYGGFLVNLTPAWNPEYAWWMEQGGLYAPVSYTHLDVYKRQLLRGAASSCGADRGSANRERTADGCRSGRSII